MPNNSFINDVIFANSIRYVNYNIRNQMFQKICLIRNKCMTDDVHLFSSGKN